MSKEKELRQLDSMVQELNKIELGLPLVWLYVWDIISNYYEDDEVIIKDKVTVWNTLIERADLEGFSLEYGSEALYSHVADFLCENDLMQYKDEEANA